MTEELVVVNEMAGLVATFEDMMTDAKFGDAESFAEGMASRISQESTKWAEKSREAKKKRWQIERKQEIVDSWVAADIRMKLLEEHHAELWQMLQEEFGRDLPHEIRAHWHCVGDERLWCGIVEEDRWNGNMNICHQMFEDELKMHQHWRSNSHHLISDYLDDYPSLEVKIPQGGKLHKSDAKHAGGTVHTAHRIGNETYAGRLYRSSFCGICWKSTGGLCGTCEGWMTKDGCMWGCE